MRDKVDIFQEKKSRHTDIMELWHKSGFMKQLTKKEAIELLPLVVDGEADNESELAFYKFIEYNPDIHNMFTNMKRMKRLLRERVPREKAPEGFKKRLLDLIDGKNRHF